MGSSISRTLLTLFVGGHGRVLNGSETKLFKHIRERDWEEVRLRAWERPAETSTWLVMEFPYRVGEKSHTMKVRFLPIHVAVSLNPPGDVIEALIKPWPKSLSGRETMYGRLPLHFACTEGASVDVVQHLLTGKARFCAQCRDKDGMLPIHLACISGAKVATIELLLNAFPQSVLLKDGRGNTPLQLAKLSPSSRNKQSTITAISHFMNVNVALAGNINRRSAEEKKNDANDKNLDVIELSETSGNLLITSPDMKSKGLTLLAKSVLDRKWDKVVQRCRVLQHTHEALVWITTYIENVENGSTTNEEWRRLPIHEACRLNPPRSVIEALCRASRVAPGSNSMSNLSGVRSKESWYNRLPLHVACSEGASARVVECLLQIDIKTAECMDKDGNLPVHLAYLNGADIEVIALLLQAYPESVFVSNYAGSTPENLVKKISRPNTFDTANMIEASQAAALQPMESNKREVLIREKFKTASTKLGEISDDDIFNTDKYTDLARSVMKQQWNAVVAHAATNEIRSGQSMWFERKAVDGTVLRQLPIHEACNMSAPDASLLALIDARPQDTQVTDSNGTLAIHIALANTDTSDKVILALLEVNPDSLITADKRNDRLPLHIAFDSGASSKVIRSLIESYDKGLSVPDATGALPLHYAIRKSAHENIILSLLNKYPEGVSTADNNGWLPIHLAYWKGISISSSVVTALLEIYPESVSRANSDGWLPIHFAAEKGLSLTTFQHILDLDPSTILFRTNSGLLPLEIAKKLPHSTPNRKDIINYLEQKQIEHEKLEKARNEGSSDIFVENEKQEDLRLSDISHQTEKETSLNLIEIDNDININAEDIIPGKESEDIIVSEDYKARGENTNIWGVKLRSVNEDSPRFAAPEIAFDEEAFFKMSLKPTPFPESANRESVQSTEISEIDNSEDSSDEEDEDFAPPGKVSLFTVASKLIERGEWNGLISRAKTKPKEFSIWVISSTPADGGESWCHLPLHKALTLNPSFDVIQALISAYPESVLYADNLAQFPLHIACKYGASADVIHYLVHDTALHDRRVREEQNEKAGETALNWAIDAFHPELDLLIGFLDS